MSHTDLIKDADAFFEVDAVTRQIINKTPTKIVLMQKDHNSERFTFKLPRYIEGHDMAQTARAQVHYMNIDSTTGAVSSDKHIFYDLAIDPDDEASVICSWLISGIATKYSGRLTFILEFDCFENDELVYSWHSNSYSGISIGETFACDDSQYVQYADIIAQWEQMLFDAQTGALASIENAKSKALIEINNSGGSELGYGKTDFTITVGTTHSSKLDQVLINIEQGEEYYVEIKSPTNSTYECWEYDENASGARNTKAGNLATNKKHKLVAEKNISAIGIYGSATSASTDLEFELAVYKIDSIMLKSYPEYYAYLSKNTDFNYTDNTLIFNNDLNIICGTKKTYVFSVNKILATATSAGLTADTTRKSITGSSRFVFYFDKTNETIGFINGNIIDNTEDKVILFFYSYGSCFGLLVDLYNAQVCRKVDANDASPAFLTDEISDTVTKAENEKELSFSFAMMTDVHHTRFATNTNWNDTILSIADVNAIYPVDAIFSLGDQIDGDLASDVSKKLLKQIRDDMLNVSENSFILTGNHDTNDYYDGTNHTDRLSVADRYSVYGRYNNTKVIKNGVSNYGYYDIDSLKIRVVMLDNLENDTLFGNNMADIGYSTEQVDWVRDVALDTDYQVIFFAHTCVTGLYNYQARQPANGVEMRNVIENFIADGGVVVGMFHGHTHWDYVGKYSDTNGFYEISTASANHKKTDTSTMPEGAVVPARTKGTVTQELWDLVIVKPLSRTVKMIRFGAGDDRTFSY